MQEAVFGPVQQLTKADQTLHTQPDPLPPPPAAPANSSSQDLSDFIEASGLLEYDPEAISRIYAGAPQRLLRRLWQTLVPIGLYLLAVSMNEYIDPRSRLDRMGGQGK